ncbi:MAG: TatD family hydrolase [Candidatus Korobacteraceae bacterium]
MYIDSHAHLDGGKFAQDRREVLDRAFAAGVDTIVTIGNGEGPLDAGCAIRIAEELDPDGCGVTHAAGPRIYATVGVHPHEARLADETAYDYLESLARHPRVIAWGEIGLDYHYDHSPREVQQQVFVRQMELAAAARLPIVIHCRPSANSENAWDDLLRLLGETWSSMGLGGILHCFTGEWKHARAALDMGFLISFSGNVTYPKTENIRESARNVPLDSILIETDSPYLAPVPHRGKRNEPSYVVETARAIAGMRGIAPEDMGNATSGNFRRFFGLQPVD